MYPPYLPFTILFFVATFIFLFTIFLFRRLDVATKHITRSPLLQKLILNIYTLLIQGSILVIGGFVWTLFFLF